MGKLLSLLTLLSAGMFIAANAQGARPEVEQTAARLAELSELRLQIELTSARVEEMLSKLAGALPPEEQRLASRAFRNAFKADVMYEDAVAYLRLKAAEPGAAGAVERVGSPLVRKMNRLEVEAARPEHRDKVGEYARGLDPERASAQKQLQLIGRLELIGRLDEATRTSEHLAEMNIQFGQAFYVALTELSPPGKRPSREEQERTISQMRAKLKEDFEDAGVVLLLYAFRSVPDAELEQYVKLCETKEGRLFAALKWGALTEAFRGAGERFGKEVSNAAGR